MPFGFDFKLELEDGTPADPPSFCAAVPNWREGDEIFVPGNRLLVIGTRLDESSDGDPVSVLVVQTADPR